jgi:hypothetical protein
MGPPLMILIAVSVLLAHSSRMRIRAWPVGVLLVTGGCAGVGLQCGQPYHDPVSLPADGTVNPATVPVDVAWDTELVVYSGGSPAPMGVEHATATCVPATQCLTRVVKPTVTSRGPRLVVVGLAPGPADVELSYEHPVRKVQMTAHLHFVFVPDALLEVDVGDELHASPFVWKHAPLAFAAAGDGGVPVETTARCEGSTYKDGPNQYKCLALEDIGGERRYASCDIAAPCSVDLVEGFSLCVERDKDGRVTFALAESTTGGAGVSSQGYIQHKQLGAWGTPLQDGCVKPP